MGQTKHVISFQGVAAKVKRCMMMAFMELKKIGFEYPQIRSEAFAIEVPREAKREQSQLEAEKTKTKEPRPRTPITPPDETSKPAPVPKLNVHNTQEYRDLQQRSKKILDVKNEEIKKLKEENQTLKAEKETQVQSIADKDAHVNRLQSEVEESKILNANLMKQLEELRGKHEKSMSQLSDFYKTNGDPTAALKAKDEEIRELKNRLNKESPVKIKSEPREYSESFYKNCNDHEELRSRLKIAEKNLRELEPKYLFKKKMLNIKEGEAKLLKEENNHLKKELNSYKSKENPVVINDE